MGHCRRWSGPAAQRGAVLSIIISRLQSVYDLLRTSRRLPIVRRKLFRGCKDSRASRWFAISKGFAMILSTTVQAHRARFCLAFGHRASPSGISNHPTTREVRPAAPRHPSNQRMAGLIKDDNAIRQHA